MQSLNEYELKIMQYLMVNESVNVKKTKELLGRADTLSRKQLNSLLQKGLIEWHGTNKSDPNQYYSLKNK